jgi:hypothetical protein
MEKVSISAMHRSDWTIQYRMKVSGPVTGYILYDTSTDAYLGTVEGINNAWAMQKELTAQHYPEELL